jgi:hypothetical protein
MAQTAHQGTKGRTAFAFTIATQQNDDATLFCGFGNASINDRLFGRHTLAVCFGGHK